jgi:hypothetical protein
MVMKVSGRLSSSGSTSRDHISSSGLMIRSWYNASYVPERTQAPSRWIMPELCKKDTQLSMACHLTALQFLLGNKLSMLALENVIAEQEQIELVDVSEGKPLAYWMHWPRRKKQIEKDGSVSGLAIQRILQRSILYLAEQKMTPDVSRKSCGRYLVSGLMGTEEKGCQS